jgi:flagellar biogenesis protein FliO
MPVLHVQLALHPASSLIAPMQGHLICVLHMHMHILCTSWLPRRREQTRKETGHHENLLQNTPKQSLGRRQVDDSPDWG